MAAASIAACDRSDGVGPEPELALAVSADSVIVGDSAQALATVDGVLVSPARWISSDTAVVRIGAGGWFHGVAPGSAALSARRPASGVVGGSVVVRVVSAVRVTPQSTELRVGNVVALSVTLRGRAGGGDQRVRWSSSDTTIATVTEGGVVTARGLGVARIEARSVARPELYGSATLTVGQNIPISLTVTPSAATLLPGATLQLTATLRDDVGTSSGVTFTSSDTRVATVSATGLVTAIESGLAVITVASFRDASFRTTATVNVREPDRQRQPAHHDGEP
jgi:hypothetical protein